MSNIDISPNIRSLSSASTPTASPMERAMEILNSVYGYQDFRFHQADIIDAMLQGHDVLTLMPTGGGKSLCYQIPALVLEGVGVIVSPLIALMQDQVNALQLIGVRAAFINSTMDRESIQQTQRQLLNGQLDLLYVAPERLLTESTLRLLEQSRVALFAIDEAHCVSQWGHDFRKEYQQLSVLHERFPNVPRIALTATADTRTREEIIEQLDLSQAQVFINSFDRPNIRYTISHAQNPRDQLWRFIQREHVNDTGIIYCLSRNKVEAVATWLSSKGREALPYHAGLPVETRRHHQERFLREDGLIIVATIAFGMGIDKPNVRFVAHLSLPKSIEAYYQETGRAGRDGETANAWMGYGLQDVITLRQMMQESDAHDQYKRISHHKLETMLGMCELITCRRESLLSYFGEKLAKPCGNCDNCINPPNTWEGTEVTQKALSCVYRTGQNFGVNYVIDVLRGSENERIKSNRHDQLSTYGLGRELSVAQWRSVFRQLIALGFLATDQEGHGALRLTEKCRPLLKGEANIQLRKLEESVKSSDRTAARSSTLRGCDVELFDALKALRLKLADEQGVPAYVIFHDKTLQDMARQRPQFLKDMGWINGVGEQKLKRYGEIFLSEIKSHPVDKLLNNNLSDTINETLHLHVQGHDAQAIAQKRQISVSTVYQHFSEVIETGLLDMRDVLSLDELEVEEILKTIELCYDDNERRLKPVFEALDGAYDYGVLRCVLAGC